MTEDSDDTIRRAVSEVIDNVRHRGDDALIEYTERWDRATLTPETLRVPAAVLDEPPEDSRFARAFARAAERIERFHARVRPRTTTFEDDDGSILGLRWTPLESVGLYVPGGKATYPSTLAMTALPARIAGVERIIVVSPPGHDGEVSPQVLLAARILGIKDVYRVGGAQAIAALATGATSLPRVDKIFGPGNAFVAEAKLQLFGEVGIDMIAGPSELVLWADETADPQWAAADLLAQAEHDESTRVILIASSPGVRDAVRRCVDELVTEAPRRRVIEASLAKNGHFEVIENPRDAAVRINEIAPEHLSVQVADPWIVLPLIRNAGAVFLGKETPVAVGDYYAGPNHVLPTGRTARFASCLSVEDFMKRSNVARMNLDFVRRASDDVAELATGEQLPAHALSVTLRRHDPSRVRPRGGVGGVTPYHLVEEEGETKLNQNESPWDVPEEIKDEVALRLKDLPWNRYHQKVPDDLLAKIAADTGLPDVGVLASSGSNLMLQWIFEAYGGPGRTVLAPAPSFSLYPLWAQVSESRLETVSLREDLSYDAGAIVDAIRRSEPSSTFLCLPNNPTGAELVTDEVRCVARAAAEVGGLLVVDEAYREFSSARYDRTPLLAEHENLVLVRTCSKAFSSAGMRLGYLLARRSLISDLSGIVPPFHLNLFAAVLGQVLFERKDVFETRVRELVAERRRLEKEVAELPGVRVYPSEANFFLFEVDDAAAVHGALAERGVLVRKPGGHPWLEGCLRVNAGTKEENDRFLAELRTILGGR